MVWAVVEALRLVTVRRMTAAQLRTFFEDRLLPWIRTQVEDRERRLLWRSFLLAVVLPVSLAMIFRSANTFLWDMVAWLIWFVLPVYVVSRALHRWAQEGDSFLGAFLRDLRVGLPIAPVGTDASSKGWAVVTTALLLANVVVFYSAVDPWIYAFASCETWGWHWSNWASLFLHADAGHLWGNMLFFWVFASPLEGRIGGRRLLLYYLLAGTGANALEVVGRLSLDNPCTRSVGASGAISGVMGLFIVRCYFSRVALGVPIFGPLGLALPAVLRIRLSAVLLLTLFFILDLSGARAMSEGVPTQIAYWAHVGGYFFGLTIAFATGLYREGLREGLEVRAAEQSDEADFGRRRRARETLLELDPDHIEALLERARDGSRFGRSEAARHDYRRVIELLLERDRRRAAEIYLEYFEKYLDAVEIEQQLALTPALAERGQLDIAARSLEFAASRPGVDPESRATALLYEGSLLGQLGLLAAAQKAYEEIITAHPDSPQAEIAEARLEQFRA